MNSGITVRRSCHIMTVSSSLLYYTPAPDRNLELLQRLCEVARPGAGYRQARAALLPEFGALNHKRVHRLWKEAKLARKKGMRRKRSGATVPCVATAANEVWCLDFCYDSCLNGTKLKVLAVKDEYTRECLAIEAATSIPSEAVCNILNRIVFQRGAPQYLRSDNGPEFTALKLKEWLTEAGSEARLIKPGSPWQNGHAESFMSRLRAECLDAEVFCNLADARLKLGIFRRFYNEQRPHSALGDITPASYAQQLRHRTEMSRIEEGAKACGSLMTAESNMPLVTTAHNMQN